MSKRKTSKSKRKTSRRKSSTKSKRTKAKNQKIKIERKQAMWKSLAESEGAYTPEEQAKWKSEAVKRYQELKQRKNETPLEKYKRQMLGYALRVHHNKPQHPDSLPKSEQENVLKNYKTYLQEREIPSIRQVGWERFLSDINKLPAEYQAELTGRVQALINKWGEDKVMEYMDNIGMLDMESQTDAYNPYLIVYAKAYVYRLESALVLAESGEAPSDMDNDLRDEIISNIEGFFKNPEVKQHLYEQISDERILNDIDATRLQEMFDEEYQEM